MDINKTIRKQNKAYKRFVLTMAFIFLILPLLVVFLHILSIYIIMYLLIIELLIIVVIFIKMNNECLKFTFNKYKLSIKNGLLHNKINIMCDKIVLVHIIEENNNWGIIILTKSKFRNKDIKAVDAGFLKNYSYVAYHYSRIKKLHPEEQYFYIILRSGSLGKYELLNTIFKNSGNAYFTDEAIEKIKEYRK